MSIASSPAASRFFDFRLGFAIPLALIALLLAIDPAGLDFAIARTFYVPGSGFIGRHSFWLEDILHDRAKQVVIALGVVAIALFLISHVSRRLRSSRRHRGDLVLSLVLSTSVVTPLRR
jgi:membrane-associated PAP2 superfamily phosphatase